MPKNKVRHTNSPRVANPRFGDSATATGVEFAEGLEIVNSEFLDFSELESKSEFDMELITIFNLQHLGIFVHDETTTTTFGSDQHGNR